MVSVVLLKLLICVLHPPLSKCDLIKTCRFLYGVQVNIHFCTFE